MLCLKFLELLCALLRAFLGFSYPKNYGWIYQSPFFFFWGGGGDGGLLCTVQQQCTAEKLSFEQSHFRILSSKPIELKVITTLTDSTLDNRSKRVTVKIFLKACGF